MSKTLHSVYSFKVISIISTVFKSMLKCFLHKGMVVFDYERNLNYDQAQYLKNKVTQGSRLRLKQSHLRPKILICELSFC